MTLRQTIQAAPAKTNELIAKLAATSNQALKTRESLFGQLSHELTLYIDLEQQHLLPLLRKHTETKTLAADAAKGNKDLRASLAELTAAPKDEDSFLEKLADLKKAFQRHVRDERKELLPAVMKALSDEEANSAAESIESGIAEAEQAKRDEKAAAAEQAKREAEDAERAAEAERAARRAAKAAERRVREAAEAAAETAQRSAAAVQEGTHQVTAAIAEQTQQAAETAQRSAAAVQDGVRKVTAVVAERTQDVAESLREALPIYRGSIEHAAEDFRALSASSNVAVQGFSEAGSALMDWVGNTTRLSAEASQQLLRCTSLTEVAETQGAFVTNSMRNWMDGNRLLLEIAQRTSKQALRPLSSRVSESA